MFERIPLADQSVLYSRARAGITELPGDIDFFKIQAKNKADGSEAPTETFATTQVIRQTLLPNGLVLTRYQTALFTEITVSSTLEIKETDPGITVRHNFLITYDKLGDYVKIQNVRGMWERLDPSVVVSDAWLVAAFQGSRIDDPVPTGDRVEKYVGYPTFGANYYLTPPTWWGYVNIVGAGFYIGAAQKSTITRGGSSWEFVTRYVWGHDPGNW